MTRLKSQQASKGEVQSVTHGEMYCTPKELLELSNLYRQIQGTCVGMDTKGAA